MYGGRRQDKGIVSCQFMDTPPDSRKKYRYIYIEETVMAMDCNAVTDCVVETDGHFSLSSTMDHI